MRILKSLEGIAFNHNKYLNNHTTIKLFNYNSLFLKEYWQLKKN